ncbi:MAG: DUF2510 domain-containing protein [Propionibacteriaceae bacterium]|nr:DUF2510 domain-containing protein [Propionibacteriaceae bacterium]
MSGAGWYPDPGRQPGMYRYWTGTEWTSAITANPATTPPPVGNIPQGPTGPLEPQRSKVGWWIGGVGTLLAIALVIYLVVQGMGQTIIPAGPDPTTPGGGQPSRNVCPDIDPTKSASPSPSTDGRVHGGKISYPQLPAPWSEPYGDNRVPFARDVAQQSITVEPNYAPDASWVAAVLVAELYAGDGFFSPEQGAEIVVKCVVGEFYGNAVVERQDLVSKAMKVDGHDAWVVESQLSFDIPNLETKGELAIVVIIDTGVESASLFYASIPDTVPDLVDDARWALDNLKVDA